MGLRKEIKEILLDSMYLTFTENDLDILTDTILERIEEVLPKEKEIIDLMCQKIYGLDHLSFSETDDFAKALLDKLRQSLGV